MPFRGSQGKRPTDANIHVGLNQGTDSNNKRGFSRRQKILQLVSQERPHRIEIADQLLWALIPFETQAI
jgi:hypothetical protein